MMTKFNTQNIYHIIKQNILYILVGIVTVLAIITGYLLNFKKIAIFTVIDYTLLVSSIIFVFSGYILMIEVIIPWIKIKRRTRKISLQNRIMSAFSLGAAIPSIIVAILSTYSFYFSIHTWFDNTVKTVLQQSVDVGKAYVQEHKTSLKQTANLLSNIISASYSDMVYKRTGFNELLNQQAFTYNLDEATLFQKQKTRNVVLGRTTLSFPLFFVGLSPDMFEKVDHEGIIYIPSTDNKIRILAKIPYHDDTYMLISRVVDPAILDHIDATQGTASKYFVLAQNISWIQLKFLIIFILITSSLLMISVVRGNKFAKSLVIPIHKVVVATNTIKQSKFDIQIAEDHLPEDEIKSLTSAFNRMIRQLKRQQQDLVESERKLAWSDVARKVAHEIKNPLTPIQLSTEMLQYKISQGAIADKEILLKYVNNILKHSNDIRNIVTRFVNFARLPVPEFKSHNIVNIIKSAVESRQLMNNKISYKFYSNISKLYFLCDKTQIDQVMLNILKNAEESLLSNKQDEYRIDVTLNVKDTIFTVIVVDNGIGFSDNIIDNINKEYITTKLYGTGLGLSIVAKIVNDHDGRFKVYNQDKEKGYATVRLEFDLTKSKNKIK